MPSGFETPRETSSGYERFARFFFPIAFFVTLGAVLWLWFRPAVIQNPIDLALSYQRETALVRAVERVAPSVVSITAVKKSSLQYSRVEDLLRKRMLGPLSAESTEIGSGIVLDEEGYILTNNHLVGGAEEVWVVTSKGEEFNASVVGTASRFDLAVIQVIDGRDSFTPAPIGDSDDLMVGEWVVALGNPYGHLLVNPEPSVTAGVISALNRDINPAEQTTTRYKNMIQTDATINPGNSGGPLVNAAGEVVGMNTFSFSQSGVSLGLGFAIPVNKCIELAQDLIKYGREPGVWVGLAVYALSEVPTHYLARLGLEGRDLDAVLVWTLEDGSPAARAGVQLGDVITAVDGERVINSTNALRAISTARVGDTITFSIERAGEKLEIPVTLEAHPSERFREVSP